MNENNPFYGYDEWINDDPTIKEMIKDAENLLKDGDTWKEVIKEGEALFKNTAF